MFIVGHGIAKYNWDDLLDESFKKKWNSMIYEIHNIPEIKIRRAYCMDKLEDSIEYTEMHGFSDASEKAFGCCIYLKFI